MHEDAADAGSAWGEYAGSLTTKWAGRDAASRDVAREADASQWRKYSAAASTDGDSAARKYTAYRDYDSTVRRAAWGQYTPDDSADGEPPATDGFVDDEPAGVEAGRAGNCS